MLKIYFATVLLFALISNIIADQQSILRNADIQKLLDDPNIPTFDLNVRRTDYNDLMSFRQKSLSSRNAQLGYFYDFLLSFPFKVGTPASKYFKLGFESGVSHFAVFDKTYNDPKRDPARPTYDPDASSTSVPIDEISVIVTAGNIFAIGKPYEEVVEFFSPDTPYKQIIDSVNDFDFPGYPFDGIFGLGWNPQANNTPGRDAAPVVNWLNLFDVEKKQFSFTLGESFNVISPGYAFPGPSVPVFSFEKNPTIILDSVQFGKYEHHEKLGAIVDTGYSTIALPKELYNQVVKVVQPKFNKETGLMVVGCGDNTQRPPKFVFTIGGVDYEVRQIHYLVDKDFPGEKCILAVSQSVDNVVRLGMPFLLTVGVTMNIEDNQMTFIPRAAA